MPVPQARKDGCCGCVRRRQKAIRSDAAQCRSFTALSTAPRNASFSKKSPSANGFGNAGQFLIDNSAGADVGVSNFRVAHLSVRQSDIHAGCTDLCVWGYSAEKAVKIRRIGCGNGVAVFAGAMPKPSIIIKIRGFFIVLPSFQIQINRFCPVSKSSRAACGTERGLRSSCRTVPELSKKRKHLCRPCEKRPLALGSSVNNCCEVRSLQRSAADEAAVNIGLSEKFCCILWRSWNRRTGWSVAFAASSS